VVSTGGGVMYALKQSTPPPPPDPQPHPRQSTLTPLLWANRPTQPFNQLSSNRIPTRPPLFEFQLNTD
jgi:hypothetical protein